MKLDRYSHHFVVSDLINNEEEVVENYARRFVEYKSTYSPDGSVSTSPDRVWAEKTKKPLGYRFHIEVLDDFKEVMDQANVTYTIEEHELYEPQKVTFPLNKKFKPFDYQEPLIDFICADGYKKVITLQTGMGKTAVFLFSIVQMQQRVVMVIPPKYFERWITDLSKNYNKQAMIPLRDGVDLMTIRGSSELCSAIMLAKSGELTAKFILLSAPTFFSYLKEYRHSGLMGKYDYTAPVDIWKLFDAGIIGVDEGHENMHGNFRLDLYTHAPKSVTLSATITPDDPFKKQMASILYPHRLREAGGSYVRYVRMLNVPYQLKFGEAPLRTSWRGRRDYNQLAFEAALLHPKAKHRFENVFNMINYDVKNYFLEYRAPDHKLLIFFDSVEMCERFSKRLAKEYPDMKVGKYTAEEEYEVLEKLDIIVATTKSADTGVDIPRLQMVFCFVARGSSQSNLQMVGRLRRLKVEGVIPTFLYYTCVDIVQHVKYHYMRKDLFSTRALMMDDRHTDFSI